MGLSLGFFLFSFGGGGRGEGCFVASLTYILHILFEVTDIGVD